MNEKRRYTIKHQRGEGTYARLVISCPFCNTETEVVKYSVEGTGKMCRCGVKHRKGISQMPKPAARRRRRTAKAA